jgi:hypothetical protein
MRNTACTVVVLLGLSCGGDKQADVEADIPLENVAAVWRKAVCEKYNSCCSSSERALNDAIGGDYASCEASLDKEITFFLGDLPASVQAGRVVYHADKMAKCVASLKARSCTEMKSPPGDLDVTQMCEGVFEPTVAPGGGCSEYWDCIGGWCAGDLGDLSVDKCLPRGDEGFACDEGTECISGLCGGNRCVKQPPGSGNICNLGTLPRGEHGIPPGGWRR